MDYEPLIDFVSVCGWQHWEELAEKDDEKFKDTVEDAEATGLCGCALAHVSRPLENQPFDLHAYVRTRLFTLFTHVFNLCVSNQAA